MLRWPRAADDTAVAAAALCVYGFTLAPTVTTGDSGELVTAAATLSLAHPTGYPLYLLLGHAIIQLLGFLSPALAMNLFSAFAATAAVVVVRRIAETLTADRAAAAGTALLLAFSASFWSQATAARVYALGALLVALGLLELARLYTGRGGSLRRAWLWFGLGLANHTVILVLAPLLAIATLRGVDRWRERVIAGAFVLPGLALYAYVPIVASLDPVQSWGDPSESGRLLSYLSRESFWSKRYVDEVGDLWRVAAHHLDEIPRELTWPGVALLWIGAASGASAPGRRTLVWTGLYLFAANVALMAWHGSRQDIFYWSRYVITGWMALALVAGLGLSRVLAALPRGAVSLVAALLVPAIALATGYTRADRSSHTWARDFAARLLEGLEPGAVLLAEEDNVVFPLSYLYHVEGLRPDVELVMQGINQLDELGIEPDRRPVYLTHPRSLGAPALRLVADGLAFRLVPSDSGFAGRPWEAAALASFEAVDSPGRDRYLDRSLVGNYYFLKALNLEPHDPATAMEAVRLLRRISFDNAVNQVNAGLLLERNLHLEEALDAFDTAAAIDPANQLAVQRARFWRSALARADAEARPEKRREVLAEALVDVGQTELALRVLDASDPER